MRETKFIEQNKEKWAEYESMLQRGNNEPEKLNDLFVQITDDLSYARTFYPNRSVKVYLNQLGQRIFHHIYKGRSFPTERLRLFWSQQMPQVMWESRHAMLLALGLFVLSFAIGVISSIINPDFARVILGDEYIEMTLTNIQNGDPMAVYKDHQPLGSAMGIAANNLFVAFRTAIFGVLASIGTAFMLMYNGIMVGAFQYFFIEKGLFSTSFLTIWIHGTLEISAIIIAGGAGLTAGSGLLFPGTFTRTQAFQISMRRGMKIFAGIVPVIILAAIFEGFLTRFTEVPDVLRAVFILANAAFVLWYFVYLPWTKARNGDFIDTDKSTDLPPQTANTISFTSIKSAGEIISDTFSIVKQNLQWTLAGIGVATLLHTLIILNTVEEIGMGRLMEYGVDTDLFNINAFMGENYSRLSRWSAIALLFLVALVGFRMTETVMPTAQRKPGNISNTLRSALVLVPIVAMTYLITNYLSTGTVWAFFRSFLLIPVIVTPFVLIAYWIATIRYSNDNLISGIGYTFKTLRAATPYLVGVFIIGLAALLLFFLESEVWKTFLQFFSWAVPPGESHVSSFIRAITLLFSTMTLFFTWLLLIVSGILHFFSHREIIAAPHLMQQIASVGTVTQIRGLPKE